MANVVKYTGAGAIADAAAMRQLTARDPMFGSMRVTQRTVISEEVFASATPSDGWAYRTANDGALAYTADGARMSVTNAPGSKVEFGATAENLPLGLAASGPCHVVRINGVPDPGVRYRFGLGTPDGQNAYLLEYYAGVFSIVTRSGGVENVIPQSTFNYDKLDGTGPSRIDILQQCGNKPIQYGGHGGGFGMTNADFWIGDVLFHRLGTSFLIRLVPGLPDPRELYRWFEVLNVDGTAGTPPSMDVLVGGYHRDGTQAPDLDLVEQRQSAPYGTTNQIVPFYAVRHARASNAAKKGTPYPIELEINQELSGTITLYAYRWTDPANQIVTPSSAWTSTQPESLIEAATITDFTNAPAAFLTRTSDVVGSTIVSMTPYYHRDVGLTYDWSKSVPAEAAHGIVFAATGTGSATIRVTLRSLQP